jgi:hypothetical protein
MWEDGMWRQAIYERDYDECWEQVSQRQKMGKSISCIQPARTGRERK